MARRIARARAPGSAEWAQGRGFGELMPVSTFAAGRSSRVLRRLRQQPEGWFDSWQDEMLAALGDVVSDLTERHGSSPETWAWGKVRPLTLPHPFGRVASLAPVFNRGPIPWGGDGNTVSQASGNNPAVIASLRFVVEVGDWDNARFVLPGGQSGNPFSPHYDDMLPLWQRGEGVPIAWSQEAVYDASLEALRLEPMT
jgi:penicillin G amidase